jgi:hypothetical protein
MLSQNEYICLKVLHMVLFSITDVFHSLYIYQADYLLTPSLTNFFLKYDKKHTFI